MNVAIILEDGRLGGPQMYALLLANSLREKINITIVIPNQESATFKRKLKEYGIPYKTLNMTRSTRNISGAARHLFLFMTETVRIYKYFKCKKFDIVYVAGGSWQYKGLIAGKFAKVKVIWHMNDTFIPFIFRLFFSLMNCLADAFTFASERTNKYYLSFIRKKKVGYIIPQPIDTSYFSPHSIPNNYDEMKILHDKIVIGTVANINPLKGLDVFIEVVSKLNISFDNLFFVIVGPVYDNQKVFFNKLLKQISIHGIKNIKFTGGQQDVRIFLRKFDIFVCTSYNESGPMTLWEAMSMEKAVVTTDVGDVSKYVHPGYSGDIVNVGDVDSLKARIMELIVNKEKREIYGINAREIIVRDLDVSICAEKHLKLFNHIYHNQ